MKNVNLGVQFSTMEEWATWPGGTATYELARSSLSASAMIVRSACIEVMVHSSRSLKDKRSVIKSIVSKVQNRYNIAVAEVGHQDSRSRSALGVAVVSGAADHAADYLEAVIRFIEGDGRVEVLSVNRY